MKTISSQEYLLELIHYRNFEEDDLSQTIVIDYETDTSSDVDDLSEVSMTSAGGISKQEFQGLLSDIAAQLGLAILTKLHVSFHQRPSHQG